MLDTDLLPPNTTEHRSRHNPLAQGTNHKIFFDNGYGASILEGGIAYGGLEIAVLQGNLEDYVLTYDTWITDDVLGYLTWDDVYGVLNNIAKLEPMVVID